MIPGSLLGLNQSGATVSIVIIKNDEILPELPLMVLSDLLEDVGQGLV